MTPTELRLFRDLVGVLAERFSGTGHVMQQVEQENRGHCPPGECCLRCTTYTALLLEACDVLEAEMARRRIEQDAGTLFGDAVSVEAPAQLDLFGEVAR